MEVEKRNSIKGIVSAAKNKVNVQGKDTFWCTLVGINWEDGTPKYFNGWGKLPFNINDEVEFDYLENPSKDPQKPYNNIINDTIRVPKLASEQPKQETPQPEKPLHHTSVVKEAQDFLMEEIKKGLVELKKGKQEDRQYWETRQDQKYRETVFSSLCEINGGDMGNTAQEKLDWIKKNLNSCFNLIKFGNKDGENVPKIQGDSTSKSG